MVYFSAKDRKEEMQEGWKEGRKERKKGEFLDNAELHLGTSIVNSDDDLDTSVVCQQR